MAARTGVLLKRYDELWARWRAGESRAGIARALGVAPSVAFKHLQMHGGITPRKRTRRDVALTAEQREEILRGLACDESTRAIARRLKRAPSTISRELKRNGGRLAYRALQADKRAWQRALRPKPCKLATNPKLKRVVAQKLARNWSPEQIMRWLKRTYASDDSMQISHETIYRSLFVQTRSVLKKELIKHLRTRRPMRRAKKSSGKLENIKDIVSIRSRPAEIEDRAVPGHWEGDLIVGKGHKSHIATLVERHSRFVLLIKLAHNDAATVTAALKKKIGSLPKELMRSITWDRGTEMARHREFTIDTAIAVYICDPASPWQRGSNENTNGLLRQYFPKGIDLNQFSQAHLNKVARELNTRPRKTLDDRTPAEVWSDVLR